MQLLTEQPSLDRTRTCISKSKFIAGLQCQKLLWHAVNTPDQFPAPDAQAQAIFDQGHELGALARTLFSGGLEIGEGIIHRKAVVQRTREALVFRKPLFEAALEYNGGYARADILNPVGADEWDIIEVKSSTTVKEVFLEDIAFQHFVFSGAGLKVRSCRILHVNNTYMRQGEVDARSLFAAVDVTAEVLSRSATVAARLHQMLRVAALDASPAQKIGPHCDSPYACALHDQCWSFLPEASVLELYRGRKKGFGLLDRGITRLADVPDDFHLTTVQTIQRTAAISGEAQVDVEAIRQFLARLQYPLYFLDFESFMTAIPLFDGVRPYQQVPFQFSLHIVAEHGAPAIHHGFLAQGASDPRRAFIDALMAVLGNRGSVIVYSAAFEKTRLRECGECFPEISGWLRQVESRMVDLLMPFRAFAYYHPTQSGSASIKALLPALCGQTYEHLEIEGGGSASREFVRVTFTGVDADERTKGYAALRAYCGLDTSGMIDLVAALHRLAA